MLSAWYFLLFLLLAVLWSCYQSLGRRFTCLRIFLLFYTGAHILLIHLYQFQFFQDNVPPADLPARLDCVCLSVFIVYSQSSDQI